MEKKNILVVDDDNAILSLFKLFLEKFGYKVKTANDGQIAVEEVILNKYDLITMDMKMPNMNGSDAIKAIRVVEPKIPILAISGFISDELKDDLKEQNIFAFIDKPFNLRDLKETIEIATDETNND